MCENIRERTHRISAAQRQPANTRSKRAQEMDRQGFSTEQIEKIFHGNVLRLYREVLK